jgi:hypothetical protein
MAMSEPELFEPAADGLCGVTLAMEDVDLNALVDEDAREFFEHKAALEEMTRWYRRDQHDAECRQGEQQGEQELHSMDHTDSNPAQPDESLNAEWMLSPLGSACSLSHPTYLDYILSVG